MPAAYKDFVDGVVLTAAELDALQTWIIDNFLAKDIGATQGMILYRGASGWAVLSAGTAGQFLQTQGAGANPQWASGTVMQMGQAEPASGTNTTSTSYVDMASTSVTLTTTGGDLVAFFTGTVYNSTSGQATLVALSLDAAAEVGERASEAAVNNDDRDVAIVRRFTGVAAGSHTIKARWKVTGGTGNTDANRRVLLVMEVKT